MSDETKTPKAGEFWVSDDGQKVAFICGFDEVGDPVVKRAGDIYDYEMAELLKRWHHEPRCDSFDWVEPPAIDPGEGWELLPKGTVIQKCDEVRIQGSTNWTATTRDGEKVFDGTYRRKITPVESPDDWVTQDRVPARPGIDQRAYADATRVTLWEDAECLTWDKPAMHGTKINNTTLEIRCRRKDLPAKQPATKRVPVRLWVSDLIGRADDEQWIVFACTGVPDKNSDTLREILHDTDGFYVETEVTE
jgi:hypothetical protein